MSNNYLNKKKGLSIISPFLNEEKNIFYLLQNINDIFKAHHKDIEVILVDDGSTDNSLKVVLENYQNFEYKIKVIKLSKNFGIWPAVLSGISNSSFDTTGLIGSDLQENVKDLLNMYKKLIENQSDVIFAMRKKEVDIGRKKFLRLFFYKFVNKLLNLEHLVRKEKTFMTVMNYKVANALTKIKDNEYFEQNFYDFVGFKKDYIEVDVANRKEGISKFKSLSSQIKNANSVIFGYSDMGSNFYLKIFILVILILFLYSIYVITNKFLGNPIDGWTSIILLISFIGTINLFFFIIILKSLQSLQRQIKKRPQYIIEEIYD